jgi:3-oxoacyl-[acyl-carrier-protein] synthase-3
MKDVFITRIEKYLPNQPISNDEMEDYLGLINDNVSKARGMILRSNQIKTRYYALNKEGKPTHTNAELTALAIKKLFDDNFQLDDVQLLTAGTSSPDTIQPAHALMVQGELGGKAIEVMSAHGTCNAAMLSLKYAYMSVLSGMTQNAVCAGSETFSSWMHARNYHKEIDRRKEIENNPYIAFEKDFLRWMLSDGASALLLQDEPNPNGLSLKIDWIEIRSYANELETCMYAGCTKDENGKVVGWRELEADQQNIQSVFSLKQDAKLLQKHIVYYGFEFLADILKSEKLDIDAIDHFLPHISSMYFKDKIMNRLEEKGISIPYEKWLLNLDRIGNIGAASAFFLIEELFHSGKLKKDEKILVMVPESARFSYTYMMMTVV